MKAQGRSVNDSGLARVTARWAFSRGPTSIAIVVLICISASALAVAASADQEGSTATYLPAESMKYRSFAKVVSNPSAFGGKALRYADPGRATRSVSLASDAERLVIRARNGSASDSRVGLRVRVDGKVVGEKLISSASYTYHSFEASIPEGTHRIGVEGYSLRGSEKAYLDDVKILPVARETASLPNDCDVTVQQTDDLDALTNSDPGKTATKFCVTAGSHVVDEPVILKDGDSITGPVGSQTTRGPASYGVPTAKIVGQRVTRVVTVRGSNVSIRWVDVSGGKGEFDPTANPNDCPSSSATNGCPVVGTGIGIALGSADGTVRVSNVRVHHNDAVGISNAKGRITKSEFFSNTLNPIFLGVVGSGIKGITEFEASRNYIHDEQGNGIWHDHSTSTDGDDPKMSDNPGGGSWFHHNLVVDNGRYGIRYESAPRDAQEGEHLPAPTFIAEDNVIAGNDNAGASHRDAQNGIWRRNEFGVQTIRGVRYGHNRNGNALVVSDSGRSDRTDLWNAEVRANALNGEVVKGCGLPDAVVSCSGNDKGG